MGYQNKLYTYSTQIDMSQVKKVLFPWSQVKKSSVSMVTSPTNVPPALPKNNHKTFNNRSIWLEEDERSHYTV